MLRIAEDKQRIWKRVTVRVVLEDGKGFTWRPCAGPGKGYTSENIQEVLEKCSDFLEKKYPNVEFRLVELEPNRFNMVYDHDRVPEPRSIATRELLDEARRIIANPLLVDRAEYPGAF